MTCYHFFCSTSAPCCLALLHELFVSFLRISVLLATNQSEKGCGSLWRNFKHLFWKEPLPSLTLLMRKHNDEQSAWDCKSAIFLAKSDSTTWSTQSEVGKLLTTHKTLELWTSEPVIFSLHTLGTSSSQKKKKLLDSIKALVLFVYFSFPILPSPNIAPNCNTFPQSPRGSW